MSTFAVKIEKVEEVQSHPNADRLDLIRVLDWWCVTSKAMFNPGDCCVYFPIDSILPAAVESAIFGPDSKVKLEKSRVRTIKLRGAISQGLAVKPTLLMSHRLLRGDVLYGDDVTAELGVTKYEPPEHSIPIGMRPGQVSKKQINPYFHKYTDIENAKNYRDVFQEGEPVWITEKIHGTSARAGWLPTECNTAWKKVLRFFNLLPKHEFVYGSRNVQLQYKINPKTFYGTNFYAEWIQKYDIKKKLGPGEVLYGEIYGDSIQKGYTYGCKPSERKFVAYDVQKDGKWLDYGDFLDFCKSREIPTVPILDITPYHSLVISPKIGGPSILAPEQSVREGLVIRSYREEVHPMLGRKILKWINPEYLLREETSFH